MRSVSVTVSMHSWLGTMDTEIRVTSAGTPELSEVLSWCMVNATIWLACFACCQEFYLASLVTFIVFSNFPNIKWKVLWTVKQTLLVFHPNMIFMGLFHTRQERKGSDNCIK